MISTDCQQKIIKLYKDGHSQVEVGIILGISHGSVSNVIRRHGIPAHPRKRKWTLNERYFETIDHPHKAYWLGFIAADGSILAGTQAEPRNPFGLRIKLASYDKNHLMRIAQDLESSAPIREVEDAKHRVEFYSTQLAEDLVKHGIIPNKTFTSSPWKGPYTLMPHYWRGVIDGDGHICEDSGRTGWPSPGVFLCGTFEMTDGFREFAQAICGTKAQPLKTKAPSGLTWQIKVSGSWQVPLLLKSLYGIGGPALQRKEETALKIIQGFKPLPPKICHLCSNDFYSRGLCKYHYGQWVRSGRPGTFKELDMQTVIMRHR